MSQFVHLHNHSDFSLLESSQSIKSLVDKVKELSMDSVALTEKNNLFSMIDFYKYALKNGIKPIIGVEISIEKSNYHQNISSDHNFYQLVLLAKK